MVKKQVTSWKIGNHSNNGTLARSCPGCWFSHCIKLRERFSPSNVYDQNKLQHKSVTRLVICTDNHRNSRAQALRHSPLLRWNDAMAIIHSLRMSNADRALKSSVGNDWVMYANIVAMMWKKYPDALTPMRSAFFAQPGDIVDKERVVAEVGRHCCLVHREIVRNLECIAFLALPGLEKYLLASEFLNL